jgi:hypothetical protein
VLSYRPARLHRLLESIPWIPLLLKSLKMPSQYCTCHWWASKCHTARGTDRDRSKVLIRYFLYICWWLIEKNQNHNFCFHLWNYFWNFENPFRNPLQRPHSDDFDPESTVHTGFFKIIPKTASMFSLQPVRVGEHPRWKDFRKRVWVSIFKIKWLYRNK